jgi:hypothetical protein
MKLRNFHVEDDGDTITAWARKKPLKNKTSINFLKDFKVTDEGKHYIKITEKKKKCKLCKKGRVK